jgi:MOSC domain-containing protein YiiM
MTSQTESREGIEAVDGHIFQINLSEDGVPKRAARSAEVTSLGLVGDSPRHPGIHGGPLRAVCLYSLERILVLQSETHPIFPGSIGENLTVEGLDWGQITPGRRLRLGETVQLEITSYTSPCKTIIDSFREGDIERVSEMKNPGWSRVYARVLQGGIIQCGDQVRIE